LDNDGDTYKNGRLWRVKWIV